MLSGTEQITSSMTMSPIQNDSNPEPDSPGDNGADGTDWHSARGAVIEVTVDGSVWPDSLVDDLRRRAPDILDRVMQREGYSAPIVSLLLCGDATMRQLNRQHRDIDKSTNVLSFPAADDWPDAAVNPMLGDVAIAAETVSSEANAAGLAAEDHLLHLFTHGVLHLLGYDHIDDDMAAEMEAFEIELLASMNIANPYDLHQRIAMLEGTQ